MTLHVQRPRPQTAEAWRSRLAAPLVNGATSSDDSGRCSRSARKISVQDWVVRFVLADILLLAGLGAAPTWLGHLLQPSLVATPQFEGQLEAIAIALCVFVISTRAVGLYRSNRIFELAPSLHKLLTALILTFAFLMALGAASKTTHDYSRLWFFSWMSASLVLLPSLRLIAIGWVRRSLRKGSFVHRALSVGIGCEPLAEQVINEWSNGLVSADGLVKLQSPAELRLLPEQIGHQSYDKVYIKAAWSMSPEVSASMGELRKISADVYLVPESTPISTNVIGVQRLADNITLQLIDRPIDGWNYWLKRAQDITTASIALLLLSPVLLAIAFAITLESRGPVIFRQRRMGFNGKAFELWKFRSMYAPQCDPNGAQQTAKNDERVTRVGSLLRRTSLDEMPQLINVLQGRMSIVGPRPHALQTTAEGQKLVEAVDDYASRHRVKPGMTGWAQIHGCRGELDSINKLKQRVDYDLEYIRSWSMLLDARIILSTLRSMLRDPNAY